MKSINLKTLKWSNVFSYGQDNEIDLSANRVTQVMGDNGAGKTSLVLILTELLFSKSLKGTKKENISNRNTDSKGYSISLDFDEHTASGVNEYTISLDRKSTAKLKLIKNGEDISEHKTSDTLKLVNEIFGGIDYKTFLPLIYQSTSVTLDFLKSTDKTRKDFLAQLLHQEAYQRNYEHFRTEWSNAKKVLASWEAKASVHESWLMKHANTDFTKLDFESEGTLQEDIEELRKELLGLDNIKENLAKENARIKRNEENKSKLKKLDQEKENKVQDLMEANSGYEEAKKEILALEKQIKEETSTLREVESDIRVCKKDKLNAEKSYNNLGGGTCPTCNQEVEVSHLDKIIKDKNLELTSLEKDCKASKICLEELNNSYNHFKNKSKYYENLLAEVQSLEKETGTLELNIDPDLNTKTSSLEDLQLKIVDTKKSLKNFEEDLNKVRSNNRNTEKHNMQIDLIAEQYTETESQLDECLKEVDYWQKSCDALGILKDSFGTKGLITYKLESSVKELETEINYYLGKLMDWQINFFTDKDKLSIQIIDADDNIIALDDCSTGELGRINIATLLAIRSIMSNLAGLSINFLFLDEIVGVLDEQGRQDLADMLLEEQMNTFMVAHGTDVHPLAEKLFIKKEEGISKVYKNG